MPPAVGGGIRSADATWRHCGREIQGRTAPFGTLDDVFGSPGVPQNYPDGNYGFNATFQMREQVTGRKAPSYLNAAYSLERHFLGRQGFRYVSRPFIEYCLLPDTASLESQSAGPPVSSGEMGHLNRNWTASRSPHPGLETACPGDEHSIRPCRVDRWPDIPATV